MNSLAVTILQLVLSLLIAVHNNPSVTDSQRQQAMAVAHQASQMMMRNVGQNTQPTVSPSATANVANQSSPVIAHNPSSVVTSTQTYTGAAFTFQYPESWQINYTNYPSQNPVVCGDANGDALLCAGFAPSIVVSSYRQKYGNVDFYLMNLTVFKTNQSFQTWCGNDRCNGQATTVNGYQASYSSNLESTDPQRGESYIIAGNNGYILKIDFMSYSESHPYGQPEEVTDYSQYLADFESIIRSIQFAK